jgi:hypothetical protein
MSEPGATSGGTLHVAADEGKTLWVADELMTFKASGEDTGGAYALTDSVVPPRATRRAERKTNTRRVRPRSILAYCPPNVSSVSRPTRRGRG